MPECALSLSLFFFNNVATFNLYFKFRIGDGVLPLGDKVFLNIRTIFFIQAYAFLEEKCLSFILWDLIVKPDGPTIISNLDNSQVGKIR